MSNGNPFFHRGAIRKADQFYGRTAETAEVLNLLRNGQSVSIIGPRRIGKSSLLMHLTREETRKPVGLDAPNALFVAVDCQELGGSPPEDVYDAFYIGLTDAAEMAGMIVPASGDSGDYRTLERCINVITQKEEASVVFLLDEFELLAANEQLTPYFFARLRGLTTKYGIAFITASQRPLYAITADEQVLSSPFFNIFVTIGLGLFSEEDARGLLARRLDGTDYEFDTAVTDHILNLVGFHPFYLHLAGYHAVQMLGQGRGLDADGLKEVDAGVEIEAESHLAYLWDNLLHDEQYTLVTVEGPIDSVRMLEQQCLIEKPDDIFEYTSAILARFVRRQAVEGILQAGPFVIDPQRHQVKAFGRVLSLTNSQFALLTRLAERYEQVVHGDSLETAVWGEVLVDDPDRLKTLIKRLRRAIEPYNDWIVSERGVGYALRPPE